MQAHHGTADHRHSPMSSMSRAAPWPGTTLVYPWSGARR
jgi:hypothetical protein